jgi:hypothetical protein
MKNLKQLFLVLCIGLVTMSCSSDDDNSSSDSITPPNGFSGEIVPVAQRNSALTGVTNFTKTSLITDKWWTPVESAVTVSGCGGGQDGTQTEDNFGAQVSFGTDGYIYNRQNNSTTENTVGEWSWANENKSKVSWNIYQLGQTYTIGFTYLNENNLVYYLNQNQGGSCTVREYLKLTF